MTIHFTYGNEYYQTFILVTIIFSFLGIVSSVLTNLLIHYMHKNKPYSGHILLVLVLSYCQLFYDIVLFTRPLRSHGLFIASESMGIVFGWGSSIVCLFMAYSVFYLAYARKKFDVVSNFYSIMICSFLPGVINVAFYLVASVPNSSGHIIVPNSWWFYSQSVYYWERVIVISLTFLLFAAVIYKVELTSPKNGTMTIAQLAVKTVSRRLLLYPVVQAFGRSGFAWFEMAYSFRPFSHFPDKKEFACLLYVAIATPLASVGYLFIFLTMQPNALSAFKELFCFQVTHKDVNGNQTSRSSSVENIIDNNYTSTASMKKNVTSSSSLHKLIADQSFDDVRKSLYAADDEHLFSFCSSHNDDESISSLGLDQKNVTSERSSILSRLLGVGSSYKTQELKLVKYPTNNSLHENPILLQQKQLDLNM